MRLKAKNIGDEISLDEYNAYQYLLYHMDCWKEKIYLDMVDGFKGDYATYHLKECDFLLNDRMDSYKISKELSNNSTIDIKLSDVSELLDKTHIQFTCTLYYKPNTIIDGENYPSGMPEENPDDNPDDSDKEPKPFDVKKEFIEITLPCTLNENTITIPLHDNSNQAFGVSTLIHRWITFNISMNTIPYIDVSNGRANDSFEILVDNEEQLQHIIDYAPNDGTLTVIRLDSSKTYYPPKTLEISKGQNIEIRGGNCKYIANSKVNEGLAVVDGTFCKRTFLVKYGAELKLNNLLLKNNNSNGHDIYDIGRGGAILVEAVRRENGVHKYGLLWCENCTFKDNKAEYGGAIFSYHAGCFIDHCIFLNNLSYKDGGAVYYWANDVRLHFANMTVEKGSTITLSVKVTDYLARPVGEGEIDFYLRDDKDVFLETVDVTEAYTRRGWATYNYKLPKDSKKTVMHFLAVYKSGAIYEQEVAMNTVNIIVPQIYTASFVGKLVGIPGETMTINVKVLNPDGGVVKKPMGTFTVGDKEYPAQHDGGVYYLKYLIDEKIEDDEIKISFELEDNLYYDCEKIEDVIKIGSDWKTPINGHITGIFVYQMNPQLITPTSKEYTDKSITDEIVTSWKSAGITDLFVLCKDYTDSYFKSTLDTVLAKVHGKGFRVHAVLNTFVKNKYVDDIEMWGEANPSVLAQKQFISKQINALLKYTSIDGICFDYCRFNGRDSTKINGNIDVSKRKEHVTDAIKQFTSEIEKLNKGIYTSVCLMPEDTDVYGQDFSAIAGLVDFVMPMAFKGDYVGVSQGSDSWIATVLNTMMINKFKISPEKILCCIQTYSSKSELDKKIEDNKIKEALRSKNNLDLTMKAIAQSKVKGVCLFREGFIIEYPMTYKSARELLG